MTEEKNLPQTANQDNELTNVSLGDVLASQTNAGENKALQDVAAADWIPLLAIAYGISASVEEGIARPGEFVLSKKTSLGTSMRAVILDYRLHACLVDNTTNDFKEHCYVDSGFSDRLSNHKAWSAFMSQEIPSGHKLDDGVDLFMWLPDHNTFASLFCKKTLKQSGIACYQASQGGRVIEIKTVKQQNKSKSRTWYTLAPSSTNKALAGSKLQGVEATLELPTDIFGKFLNQFRNPPKPATETVSEADAAPVRDR